MNPIERLESSINIIRFVMKMLAQDIFVNTPHANRIKYLLLMVAFFDAFCIVLTINDSERYTLMTRFLCGGLLIGGLQVGIYITHYDTREV